MYNTFDSLMNEAYSPLIIVHSYYDSDDKSSESKKLIKSFENDITSPFGIKISFMDYKTYSKFESNCWDSLLLNAINNNLPTRSEIYDKLHDNSTDRLWFDNWSFEVCRGLRLNGGPPSGRIILASNISTLDYVGNMLGKMGGRGSVLVFIDDSNKIDSDESILLELKEHLKRYELDSRFTVEYFRNDTYIKIVELWLRGILELLESEYDELLRVSNWDESLVKNVNSSVNKKGFWWETKFFKNLESRLKDATVNTAREIERPIDKKILSKTVSLGLSLGKFKEIYGMLLYLSTRDTFDSGDMGGKWLEYLAISHLCMDEIPEALNHLYNSFTKYRNCGYFRRCLWIGIVAIYIYRSRRIRNIDNWTVSSISLDLEGSNFYSQDSTKDIQMSMHARAALLLEQSAIVDCHNPISITSSGYTRKGSVQLILAGHRFTSSEFRSLALFCYMQVAKNFSFWPLAFEHLLLTMARQAVLLGLMKDAVWHYVLLISFIFYENNLESYQSDKKMSTLKQLIQAISDYRAEGESIESLSICNLGESMLDLFGEIGIRLNENGFPIRVLKLLNGKLFIQLQDDEYITGNDNELLYGTSDDLYDNSYFSSGDIRYQSALIQREIMRRSRVDSNKIYKYFEGHVLNVLKMFPRRLLPGSNFFIKLHLCNPLDTSITCQSVILISDLDYIKCDSQFICLGPLEKKVVKISASLKGDAEGLINILGLKYRIFGSIDAYLPFDGMNLQIRVSKNVYNKVVMDNNNSLDVLSVYQGQFYSLHIESADDFDLVVYPSTLIRNDLKVMGKCLLYRGCNLDLQINTSNIGFYRLYILINDRLYQRLITVREHLRIIDSRIYNHELVSVCLMNSSDSQIDIDGGCTLYSNETRALYINHSNLIDNPFKSREILINNKCIGWRIGLISGVMKLPVLVNFTELSQLMPIGGITLPIVGRVSCADRIVDWDFKNPYKFNIAMDLYNYSKEDIDVDICIGGFNNSIWPRVSYFIGRINHFIRIKSCESIRVDFIALLFSPGVYDMSGFTIRLPGLEIGIPLPESLIIVNVK